MKTGNKVLTLVKAADGTDAAAFRAYWQGPYLRSLLDMQNAGRTLTKVTHNHVVPLTIREDAQAEAADWSGVGELWFDSPQDAGEFVRHAGLAANRAEHAGRIAEVVHLLCGELPIWDNGLETPSVKLIAFFHPSAAMDRVQSQHYWTHTHVDVGSATNQPQRFAPRYVQNHVLEDFHTADPRYDFVGAPELWFYSPDAALQLFNTSDRMDELRADEAKFSDPARTITLVTDEQVVYSRGAV